MQLLDWKLTAESAEDAEKRSGKIVTDDELTEAIIGQEINRGERGGRRERIKDHYD
jgi:hypothetical protein